MKSFSEKISIRKQARETAWHTAGLGLVAAVLALLAIYHETAWSLVSTWARTGEFQHGFLILPIAGYLAWTNRDAVKGCELKRNNAALLIVILLGVIWALGRAAGVNLLQHFALVGSLPALVLYFFGSTVAHRMLYPLFYTLLAVPAGQEFVGPLQDFTAYFAVGALQLTGIPVLMQGYYISIPAGDFEVTEACSGVRFMIATTALAMAYVYIMYRRPMKRLVFVVIAIAVAIVANGVRAYGTILIAHLSDMRLATGVDHLVYGWQFYGVVMLLLFWIGARWRDTQTVSEPAAGREGVPAGVTASRMIGGTLLVVPALLVGPALGYVAREAGEDREAASLDAPRGAAEWRGPFEATADGAPGTGPWQGELDTLYTSPAGSVFAVVDYHAGAKDSDPLRRSTEAFDMKRWRAIAPARAAPVVKQGIAMNELRLQAASGEERLAWFCYYAGHSCTGDVLKAKIDRAWHRLVSGGSFSAVILFATDIENDDMAGAKTVLGSYVRDMFDAWDRALEATGRR